jgi:NADH-quinone oxidoreductase subunit L
MMCASLAIAGVPPFAGYYSKDAILLAASHHAMWIYWLGTVTAGITAFYVFRAIFLTFFGRYRGTAHPHESPPVMLVPLVILALLSFAGGFLFNVPEYLGKLFPAVEAPEEAVLGLIPMAAGLLGILLAWVVYLAKPGLADSLADSVKGLYTAVYNKFWVDEIYDAAVVGPVVNGSRVVLWKGVDVGLIDGAVNGVGARARNLGEVLRMLQSGNIRSYATWVLFGSVLVIVAIGIAIAGGIR